MTYYACNMNLELQTRAVEYTSLFTKHNIIRYRYAYISYRIDLCFFLLLRPSIVERMPVLISSQTPTGTNGDQQEQIYDQEENLTNDQHTNHVGPTNQPVVEEKKRENSILYLIFIVG